MAKTQTYKQKLLDVSAMKTQGLEGLHQRVVKLVEVFNDEAFRGDINGDDYALADVLDRYVDDCALTFLQLRSVLEKFPAADMWSTTPLRELYEQALNASHVDAQNTDEDAPKRERRAAKVADLVAAQEKLKDAECRVESMRSELGELRTENRRLIAENSRLEGRIVELERFFSLVEK